MQPLGSSAVLGASQPHLQHFQQHSLRPGARRLAFVKQVIRQKGKGGWRLLTTMLAVEIRTGISTPHQPQISNSIRTAGC